MEYFAFSDESYSSDRYRSIASFSLVAHCLEEVNAKLKRLLAQSSVTEFKWVKVKDAKYRHCALKLIGALWSLISSADARIDVIVWDTQDKRHSIQNRDDKQNYERMFYHLHSHALKRRPKNSDWHIFPDERVDINWKVIRQCLNAKGQQRDYIHLPLIGGFLADQHFNIVSFKQVESHSEPCCQIADLFAGLAVYSCTHYDLYNQWLMKNNPTLNIFQENDFSLSNREENRFRILLTFDRGCKTRRIGVSLAEKKGLYTPDPKNPINFWHYKPQHEKDRAPTKGNRI